MNDDVPPVPPQNSTLQQPNPIHSAVKAGPSPSLAAPLLTAMKVRGRNIDPMIASVRLACSLPMDMDDTTSPARRPTWSVNASRSADTPTAWGGGSRRDGRVPVQYKHEGRKLQDVIYLFVPSGVLAGGASCVYDIITDDRGGSTLHWV